MLLPSSTCQATLLTAADSGIIALLRMKQQAQFSPLILSSTHTGHSNIKIGAHLLNS